MKANPNDHLMDFKNSPKPRKLVCSIPKLHL